MQRVTAAVIIENGRLFLCRRPPTDRLAGMWELPGGKVETGETPEQCLARELQEELAMACEVHELLATTTYEYQHGAFELLAFRVSRASGFELRVHDRWEWVPLDEVSAYPLAPADVDLVAQLG
ncbi:MAG: (deoxy)nucleoside triphosphate pyrophosphohydrolase [Coriobacteriia bacterium]